MLIIMLIIFQKIFIYCNNLYIIDYNIFQVFFSYNKVSGIIYDPYISF